MKNPQHLKFPSLRKGLIALLTLVCLLGMTNAFAAKDKTPVRNHRCKILSVDHDMMTLKVMVAGVETEATVPFGENTVVFYEQNMKLRALDEGALVQASGRLAEDGSSVSVGWVYQLPEGTDKTPRTWKNGAIGILKKVGADYALEVDDKDVIIEGDPKVRKQYPATIDDLKEGLQIIARGRLQKGEIRPQNIAIQGAPPKPAEDDEEE